ncbi:MAG: hypothetical protein K8H85_05800 [Cyclobacteriaceae bacterium]|nr:hypothetical protein [Cyclobacteriaceae bacterium]
MEKASFNFNKFILTGLGALAVILLFGWAISSMVKRDAQAHDFVAREINGIITYLKYSEHGEYRLRIKEFATGEELKYYLYLSPFIEENMIQTGDSISKTANGNLIEFYKKDSIVFKKCCELNYY